MTETLQPLITNIGLLALVAWLMPSRKVRGASLSWQVRTSFGIGFGLTAALLMAFPIPLTEGVFGDGRGAPLLIAGLVGGPISATVASLIAGLTRGVIGGAGTWAGIVYIVSVGVLGTFFWSYLKRCNQGFPDWRLLLGFAVIASVITLPVVLLLPEELRLRALTVIWLQSSTATVIGIILFGYAIRAKDLNRNFQDGAEIESEFIEGILNAQPAHIAVVDGEGTILKVNKAWEMFNNDNGGAPRNWIGENYFHHCYLDSPNAFENTIPEQIQKVIHGEMDTFEHLYPCHGPDVERWFVMICCRIDGEPAAGAVVFHFDVTDRVQAEMKATEERWRYEALIRNAVVGFVTIDEAGTILSANPAIERMFGYARANLVGENVSILMPEPDRSHHDGYLKAFSGEQESKVIGMGREVVARRRNGETFPIHLAVSVIDNDEGQMFAGTLMDLSVQGSPPATGASERAGGGGQPR